MTDRQQIIVDLEVNIARARESLQEMKNISKDGLLGKAGTKKSDTELQNLIKKFDQLKTKIPTINSGEKEFKEFFSAVKKTATEVDKCVGKMTNFDITDDYIKKNVVALREFVQKADEASKKVNNIKMNIGKTAKDTYGSLISVGVAGMFLAHFLENVGMNIGLMPITGIPLPFISYGGSAMLTNFVGLGLLLSVSARRNKKMFE
jgi:hypothetical protein